MRTLDWFELAFEQMRAEVSAREVAVWPCMLSA